MRLALVLLVLVGCGAPQMACPPHAHRLAEWDESETDWCSCDEGYCSTEDYGACVLPPTVSTTALGNECLGLRVIVRAEPQ